MEGLLGQAWLHTPPSCSIIRELRVPSLQGFHTSTQKNLHCPLPYDHPAMQLWGQGPL